MPWLPLVLWLGRIETPRSVGDPDHRLTGGTTLSRVGRGRSEALLTIFEISTPKSTNLSDLLLVNLHIAR